MKVTYSEWQDGSGWSTQNVGYDNFIDERTPQEIVGTTDWEWVRNSVSGNPDARDKFADGKDVQWKISVYDLDDENCDNPLAEASVWESEFLEPEEREATKNEPLFSRSRIMADDFKPTSQKSQDDKGHKKDQSMDIA